MVRPHSKFEDIKIICEEDCGNAPKKNLLKEFNIAFAIKDSEFVLGNIADNIVWEIIGDRIIEGKEQFTVMIQQSKARKIKELHIKNIITHGRNGTVNGTFIFEDGKSQDYCDVYNFLSGTGKNAKIKEITTYIIEIK